jgi:hypothetical protein
MQITKPGESLSGSTDPLFQSVDIKVRTSMESHFMLVTTFIKSFSTHQAYTSTVVAVSLHSCSHQP